VLFAAAAVLLTTLISTAVSTLASYREVRLNQRVFYNVRIHLFAHFQLLSLAFHERQSVGDTLYSLDADAYSPASLLTDSVIPLVTSAITLAAMFAVLWRLNPATAWTATCVVPFLLLCIRYNAHQLEQHSEIVRERESDVYSTINDTFSAIKLVAAFAREREEGRRFRKRSDLAFKERMALTRREMLFSVALDMVLTGGTAGIIAVVGYNVLNGRMTAGEFWVVFTYLNKVYEPLHTLSHTFGGLKEAMVGVRRVMDVLNEVPEVVERPNAVALTPPVGPLRFDDVHFAYPDSEEVLHGVTLEVSPGETVAIVGPTGAGKSTLLGLILRFYDVQSGAVSIGARDIRSLTLRSLRESVSVVTQDSLLIPGTIADNIGYGRLHAKIEDIRRAARMACADDFIEELPEGYDTVLGEGGAGLSGGQRQRIAIARAFLKDAPILLLDEPTSALDVATEREVVSAWEALMKGRTTLIVAHRLSTVADADRIIVIDGGRIVEEGPPAQLLAGGGLYGQWSRMSGEES
jgi:ATP-binding cassette subfamily B protein/subfamily B ATP-binding cassette protein MsbA